MPKQPFPKKQSLALFEEYKQAIVGALAAYFDKLPDQFAHMQLPTIGATAVDLIAEYTLRPGKRIRGALAAMAYDRLTNRHLSENGLRLAVVMEIIQSYLLITDDVADKSDLRRGEPTVHRRYEQLYQGKVSEREAEQLATFTGMVAGHMAQDLLAGTNEAPERVVAAIRYVNKNIVITGLGQLEDIIQEITREAAHDDIIRKYSLKTSHYTFINPLQAGMALAGIIDPAAYDQVAVFGTAAGVAFQTHDDYLGVFGTAEETGKPTTDDIKEGKLTILTEHALNTGSTADVKTLRSYLGNPAFSERDLLTARGIFDKTGATMEARRVAETYADEAVRALEAITIWSAAFNAQLAELVMYSINRKS